MQTINYASLRGVRITLLTLSALLMTFLSYGRQIDFSKMESMKPRNIGPANMSGRITSIDVVRNNQKLFMQVLPQVVFGNLKVGVSLGNLFLMIT